MNDSRWVVDTTVETVRPYSDSEFNIALMKMLIPKIDIFSEAVLGFITELVHEIERLQTQVIEQHNTITRLTDALSVMEPPHYDMAVSLDEGWFE